MISSGHALHMLGDTVDASVPAKADHQHMIDKQTHQDTDMSTGKKVETIGISKIEAGRKIGKKMKIEACLRERQRCGVRRREDALPIQEAGIRAKRVLQERHSS